jgi:hypothetical protein
LKDLARVGFDAFSTSFDIKLSRGTIRNEGSFDAKNAKAVRDRWKLVADAIVAAHMENLREQGVGHAVTTAEFTRAPTQPLSLESETFECDECGAKLMKGENHDCAKVQLERRRLGHRLPKDPSK